MVNLDELKKAFEVSKKAREAEKEARNPKTQKKVEQGDEFDYGPARSGRVGPKPSLERGSR